MEIKILVVDNDYSSLGLLQTTLEMEGYIVSCLDNGKFLKDAILLYNPDLILLDIMINPIAVEEVLNNLKVNYATKEIPVVMIFALQDTFAIEEIINQVEPFIPNPFDIEGMGGDVERLTA
jgi:DNA-binding response OmpR family regulator